MSIESARFFIKRMKVDEDFAKKITACADAQERNTVARDAGFDFNPDELKIAEMIVELEEQDNEKAWEKARTGCFYDRTDEDYEDDACMGVYVPH